MGNLHSEWSICSNIEDYVSLVVLLEMGNLHWNAACVPSLKSGFELNFSLYLHIFKKNNLITFLLFSSCFDLNRLEIGQKEIKDWLCSLKTPRHLTRISMSTELWSSRPSLWVPWIFARQLFDLTFVTLLLIVSHLISICKAIAALFFIPNRRLVWGLLK